MPTYEYMCAKCEHEFEREQRMSDPPVKTCPKCRSRRVKKLISRTSFVLKGGGWYSDLYASSPSGKDGSKEGAKDGAAEGGKQGAKEGGKSEGSKSDASSSSKSGEKSKSSGKSSKASAA